MANTKIQNRCDAEFAGHVTGDTMLRNIAPLEEYSEQAQAIREIMSALKKLCKLPARDCDAAIAGFAVQLACIVQRGLKGATT